MTHDLVMRRRSDSARKFTLLRVIYCALRTFCAFFRRSLSLDMSTIRSMNWTGERIDDLAKRMDYGFDQVNNRIERGELALVTFQSEVRAGLAGVNGRIDRIFNLLLAGFISLVVSLVGVIAAFVLAA
jgi:hypothetical protein